MQAQARYRNVLEDKDTLEALSNVVDEMSFDPSVAHANSIGRSQTNPTHGTTDGAVKQELGKKSIGRRSGIGIDKRGRHPASKRARWFLESSRPTWIQ
jgi:hypothetical protein